MRPALGVLSPLEVPLDYPMKQSEVVLWIGLLLYWVVNFAQPQARIALPVLPILLHSMRVAQAEVQESSVPVELW